MRRSEKIAGATDIEILHRYMDSGTEIREGFDGLKAAARHGGQRHAGGHKEITECLAAAAADPASQLMKLAQTEMVRVVDDYRVDIRHIYAVLDDCCGKQHIIIMIRKIDYGFLKLFGRHLAVGRDHPHSRHNPFQTRLYVDKVIYTV